MKNSADGKPPHLQWLIEKPSSLKTSDGKPIRVLELRHAKDEKLLSAWAKHFRSHYCDDSQLDALLKGTKLSRAQYLKTIKFPDAAKPPGPSIRSGDFGEILVADFVEYVLGFWVPRTRYANKTIRNESTKGTDILGFKVSGKDDDVSDALALFEAKAQLSSGPPAVRLQDAIVDSAKDELRKSESLNAIKQKYLDRDMQAEVGIIERFQNPEDRPYAETYGAVAIACCDELEEAHVAQISTSTHPFRENLMLVVIHGVSMMDLVHDLYRRAADEA